MRRVNPSYIIRAWERSQFTTTVFKMAKTFELTEKETKLAQCADIEWKWFTEETGYQNCDGDPAAFCFDLNDGLEAGFTKHELAGVIGSLEKKEVIDIEQRDPIQGGTLYWLTTSFINFIAAKNIQANK